MTIHFPEFPRKYIHESTSKLNVGMYVYVYRRICPYVAHRQLVWAHTLRFFSHTYFVIFSRGKAVATSCGLLPHSALHLIMCLYVFESVRVCVYMFISMCVGSRVLRLINSFCPFYPLAPFFATAHWETSGDANDADVDANAGAGSNGSNSHRKEASRHD